MAEVQVIRIDKDNGNHQNPYEAIRRFEWYNPVTGNTGINNLASMVSYVDNGNRVYVERVKPRAYCFVNKSGAGTRFLQTEADATKENNLLSLDEIR